jgi:hypothetical protein
LSGLLLLYHWCNFNETLQVLSISQVVLCKKHILHWLPAWMVLSELWSLNKKDVEKVLLYYSSYTSTQFQWKFTGLIGSSSSCAYYTGLLKYYWRSYWPWIIQVCVFVLPATCREACLDYSSETAGVISSKLYSNDQYQAYMCIVSPTLQEWSST